MDSTHSGSDELLAVLTTPRQSENNLTFCEASVDGVKQFVKRLPHTNQAEVLFRLYNAIPELAGLNAGPGKKVAMLDELAAAVLTSADKLLQKTPFSEKSRKSYSLCLSMLRELACGYSSIIVQAYKDTTLPPQIIAKAIHSAMAVHSHVLLICWSNYLSIPKGVWRQVHSLFQLAQLTGANHINVKDSTITEGLGDSIEDCYISIMMVGAIDPYGKASQDLKTLYNFFQTHTDVIQFGKAADNNLFIADPNSDHPPTYHSKTRGNRQHQLSLNPQKLLEALNIEGDSQLPQRLAKLVSRYCSGEVLRRDNYEGDETEVMVILGLGRVHHLLSHTDSIDQFVADHLDPDQAPARLKRTLTQPEGFGHDGDEGKWIRHLAKNPEEVINFSTISRENTAEESIKKYRAQQINRSAKGARLHLTDNTDKFKPGELIAVRRANGKRWKLGIIRWARTESVKTRTFGLEYLTGTAQPCAVAMVKADKNISPYFPGLLRTLEEERKELLVPSMPFTKGARVRMIDANNHVITQLGALHEGTYHLSCFYLDK